MREPRDVLVVGAGAAGMWAAARAAEAGLDVLVLEKTARAGTKVLASGGSRCNLTTTLGPEAAAALFGLHGQRFLARAFAALPPRAVRERFHALGVPTVEAPLEKVFPASDRARDVRDALLAWALGAGARVALEAPVRGIEPKAGGWRVHVAGGEPLESRLLFLCSGGASVPRSGTTGEGYGWLRGLGLRLVEPVPALVPLASPAPWVRELAGIALQSVSARIVDERGRTLAARARPVVFTHQGISGPGAMDLAEPVARGLGKRLLLDLVPALEREALRAALIAAAGAKGAPHLVSVLQNLAETAGHDAPARRLLSAVANQAGLAENPAANALTKSTRHAWIEALKGLSIPVAGTLGWERAEVTAGGLHLAQVDPGSGRVRGFHGLFVFGELLDLAGPIGGLNFQAAWALAELAARSAAAELR
jgi:hypothetical protein